MALIEFKNLPDTTTPITAENLNNNFNECNNIVESGSNANGNYIKYSDGTMICTKSYSGNINISAQLGNVYYTGIYAQAGDLPQTFTSVYASLVNVINDYEIWSSTSFSATTTKWPSRVNAYSAQVKNNVHIRIDMMVIGKWK